MPSFLDELRNKRQTAICEEQEKSSFDNKLLLHKVEIVDKLMQLSIDYSISWIKKKLTDIVVDNSKANNALIEIHCADERYFNLMDMYGLQSVFSEYGYDFDKIENLDDRLNPLLKEMGLTCKVYYDYEDHKYHLDGALPQLYETKSYGFGGFRELTDYGEKYMGELADKASREGIQFKYYSRFSCIPHPSTIVQCEKNAKRVIAIASVTL